jgi:hypothetical protein
VLALAAALELREHFSAGQLYVELGGIGQARHPEEVLTGLLQTLGVPAAEVPADALARAAMYRALVGGRRVLLIADDAVSAAQVRPLLPGGGSAAVLVTSRGRLAGLAGAKIIETDVLPAREARGLLASVAGPGRIAGESDAADAVVSACGCLPLALRLAGTALAGRPGMTVSRLAADLRDDRIFDVLRAEDVSVSGALASSFGAISAGAANALHLVTRAVPGEIPGWALTELADGDETVAGQLVAAGLLSPAPAEMAGARYRCHRLTRLYSRLCRPDDSARAGEDETRDAAALTRLRGAWLHRADWAAAQVPARPFLARPAPLGPGPAWSPEDRSDLAAQTGRDWLEAERVNLLSAAAQACAAADGPAAHAIAARHLAHQCMTGQHEDAAEMWQLIHAAGVAAGDKALAIGAQYHRAVALAEDERRVADAAGLLASCAPLLEQLGCADAAAMAYGLLGSCASRSQRHAAAIRACQHAARLAGAGSEGDLIRCSVRAVLGETIVRIGLEGIGLALCQRAVREARELGEPEVEAFAQRALTTSLGAAGRAGHVAACRAAGDEANLARA